MLTPENVALLQAAQAKIGLNPATSGIIMAYNFLLVLKQAIETANSLDGTKLAAAIEQIKNLQLDSPGVQDSFSASDHTGWPGA